MSNDRLQEQSTADLLKRLSEQTATLVRQEIRLAQLELQEKGKRAGIGAGMFGGSGLIALYGLGALVAAAILGLATAVDAWLAALIVGVVYLLAAGVQALIGRSQVQRATPPAPEQTVESVKEDVEWAKTRAKSGKR